ncbi:hypothetical protein OESDEN_08146 [Oesophagostomum dentatum]|uniref:Uncharacterized protein n=1 Tax=Oesophagostomum dentatum TaxID=61180 RepID=A0A0B1T328_OESDE|nr:hypothetical protein OESDEN_08146 [Oesophagostomum dentatum]
MSERFSQQQMEKMQQISDLKAQLQAAAMEAAAAKAEAEKFYSLTHKKRVSKEN